MPVVKATLKRKRELISTVKAKKVEKRCSLQSDILVEASHFKNHEGKKMAKAGIGFADLKDVFSRYGSRVFWRCLHATGRSFKRKAIPTCNK